ncbi:MAG: aminopeptidase P family protein [Deltaproteobacteria bacterium]|nr:aminopeptidase P family protein [Deltaproteobacteria bacterium]
MRPDINPNSEKKISFIQSQLTAFDTEAVLILDLKNIRYLTGFTGSDGALFIGQQFALLMVDGRYVTQAGRESQGLDIYEYRDKTTGILTVIKDKNIKNVGFEPVSMSADIYLKIIDGANDIFLTPLMDLLNSMRAIKSEDEINLIKKAIDISAEALKSVEPILRPGISEMDIALELEYKMRRNGSEQVSFPTIAASGINSALPHASPGRRKLKDGDALVIDYGATYRGYHSDETWTCFIGHADDKQKEVYDIVKKAHDRALGELRSGINAKDVDAIARSYIADSGFDGFFPHGTGHGVGLDVHETPRIAVTSDTVLKAGMVVTIEPGIYIPDLWGIRIEDMALIKEDSCEILTKTPKNLRVFV